MYRRSCCEKHAGRTNRTSGLLFLLNHGGFEVFLCIWVPIVFFWTLCQKYIYCTRKLMKPEHGPFAFLYSHLLLSQLCSLTFLSEKIPHQYSCSFCIMSFPFVGPNAVHRRSAEEKFTVSAEISLRLQMPRKAEEVDAKKLSVEITKAVYVGRHILVISTGDSFWRHILRSPRPVFQEAGPFFLGGVGLLLKKRTALFLNQDRGPEEGRKRSQKSDCNGQIPKGFIMSPPAFMVRMFLADSQPLWCVVAYRKTSQDRKHCGAPNRSKSNAVHDIRPARCREYWSTTRRVVMLILAVPMT